MIISVTVLSRVVSADLSTAYVASKDHALKKGRRVLTSPARLYY